MFVYLDGDFVPRNKAKIPIDDRGFLFGDGVYTTLLVENGSIYFLEEHLGCLKNGCKHLHINPPHIKEEWLDKLISLNLANSGTFRLKIIITGGNNPSLALPKRDFSHLLITLDPFFRPPYAPLACALYPIPTMVSHASFKSLAHLNRYYVMDYAKQSGKDDGITLTESGLLLEASFGNLFWISGETLFTPDPSLPLYFGVTLQKVIEGAINLGFKTQFVKAPLSRISQEAQIFRTNTLRGIRPITLIEEKTFSRDIELENALLSEYKKNLSLETRERICID